MKESVMKTKTTYYDLCLQYVSEFVNKAGDVSTLIEQLTGVQEAMVHYRNGPDEYDAPVRKEHHTRFGVT